MSGERDGGGWLSLQDEEQAQRMLGLVEAELRAGGRLRFSPAVELDYLASGDSARVRDVQRFGVAGLVLYNLFPLIDRLIVPDVFSRAVLLHMAVVTPLAVLAIGVARRRAELVELATASMLLLVLLCTVLLFTWSQAAEAPLLPFAFPLILMAGHLIAPLRFEVAVGVSLAGSVGIVAAVLRHPGYTDGTRWFTLQVVLATVTCGLFMAYRREASGRTAYLLRRREDLQAKVDMRQKREMRDPSDFDGLTGLGSRAYFDATLERLWRDGLPESGRVGLLLVDLDYFKNLNQSYGQQTGDRCLLLVADVLREHTRRGDHATRYGGAEFAILLPGAPLHAAQGVAERMRVATEALVVMLGDRAEAGALSVSVGCASMAPSDTTSPADLIGAAEAALYTAKRNGCNRIHPPAAAQAP